MGEDEYNQMLKLWIKHEHNLILNQENIKKLEGFSKLFNNADIILCSRGRSAYSKQMYGEKHPILLRDLTSYFRQLIIRDARNNVRHQGIKSRIGIVFYSKKLVDFKEVFGF